MPVIERHPPGAFNWFELASNDQKAANGFYSTLFGWTVMDFPMGPEEVYSMMMIEGQPVAASYTMGKNMQAQGVPPHWNIYMSVESADGTAKRAAELGGTVIATPFDVQEFGRMAVIADPGGALFSVWQPKTHKGTGIGGVDGTICWADLHAPNQVKAKDFYSSLFGWDIFASPNDESGYLHIKNGEEFIGGILPEKDINPKAPPHWLIYFLVPDCDKSAARAKELGAELILPPFDVARVGRVAIIKDPQGAVSSLFEPLKNAPA